MRRAVGIASLAVFALAIPLQADAAPCAGFTDVDDTNLFCTNVAWIRNRNITLGCAAGLYCPNDAVTRLSMAAFLSRLGDVVLPPNVIWVAPVGGMFQSIQAAIDYAASLPPNPRRLIKVAPGTYNEAIVMAPGVDVEGSGEEATVISATVCDNVLPTAGTVTSINAGQLRHVGVSLGTVATAAQCAVIYVGGGGTEVPLRNVKVTMNGSTSGESFGIRIAAPPNTQYFLTLENIVVDAATLIGGGIVGISATGAMGAKVTFRDVRVRVLSDTLGSAIRLIGADASLDRVEALATNVMGATMKALDVQGSTSNISVQRSSLRAPAGAYATNAHPAATLRIATPLLEGTSAGLLTCFQNYDPSLAPIIC